MLPPHLIKSPHHIVPPRYWFIWPKESDIQPMPDDPINVEFVYEPNETINITINYDAPQHPDNIVYVKRNNYRDINHIDVIIILGPKHTASKIILNCSSSVLSVTIPGEKLPDWLKAHTVHFTFNNNNTLHTIHRVVPEFGPNAIYFNSRGEIESLEYTNSAILVNIMNSHTNQFKVTGMRRIDKWAAFFDPN